MIFAFIISSSNDFLVEKKELLLQEDYFIPCEEPGCTENRIIQFKYDPNADWGDDKKRLDEYDRLFYLINEVLQKNDPVHNRFIGIVDCASADHAWEMHSLTEIPGMIILSFPEILWLPAYKTGVIGSPTMGLKKAVALCRGGYTPLFDGDGLRGILLSRARRGATHSDIRRDVVFAIDEEPHFAYMNTYTAFRFGYRGFPVMTSQCAEILLKSNSRETIPCATGFDNPKGKTTRPLVNSVAVFEDICLNFPDAIISYTDKEIPFGTARDRHFPMIAGADLRVIATATPRNERVANVGEDRLITLDQYFGKYCFNYRSVSCHSRKWSKQLRYWIKKGCTIFRHHFFNRTGGWWGYGLVNILAIGLAIFALGVLFLKQRFFLFFLTLLLIYLWFSIREWLGQLTIRLMSRHMSPGRSFFFKRLQWPYMPKYYISHEPISYQKASDAGIHFWEEAHKPLAGIFDFRNNCGLPNGIGFHGIDSNSAIKQFYRNAIKNGVFSGGQDEDSNTRIDSHASRGTSLDIAMRLIRRAEQMKDIIVDVEGAVHAAVLSDVALELLDHKTPATSMEALQWKHYYEILAECEFVGVRAHLNIEDRYIDIHNAMGKICRINRRVVRKDVFISGMAEIIDKLVDLLKSNGKLEEAAFFTTHSRRLHRKLLFTPVRAFLAYPEWVLRTKWNFLISFGCFFILFFLYWLFVEGKSFDNSVMVTCKVMLARIQEDSNNPTTMNIILLARQVAVLHLCFVAARFLMFMDRK